MRNLRTALFEITSRASLVVAFAFLLANPAHAQQEALEQGSRDGSALSVYLVTVGPGALLWEKFGHNAILIRDSADDVDLAYNYGLFSFEQENFLSRFLQGRMEYWMRGFDAAPHIQQYIAENRSVWIQELNLSNSQKLELQNFLRWNELPENRFYRYHYFHDNCSTRIRDAIDRVVGGAIGEQTQPVYPGTTLRFHSLRLVSDDVWTYIGLSLGLAQPVDEPLSAWDEMFLPMKLREHINNVVVLDDDGTEAPLVLSEQTLHESSEFVEQATPPRWMLWFLLCGLALGFSVLLLAHKATRAGWAKLVLSGLTGIWYSVIGIVGIGLAGLWLFTDHDTSYRNENLFWFDPVAILLVVLAPLLIYRVKWAERPARLLAVFVAGASLLGLALKILPGMDQVNGHLIALALPTNLACAAALLWVSSIE